MAGAVRYTLGQLYGLITPAFEKALAAKAQIADNSHRIAVAFTNARAMRDGPAKTRALAALGDVSRQQAQIKLDFAAFAQRWNAATKQLNDFAARQGYSGPDMLLAGFGGLGQLELVVGASIAAVVLAAVGYAAYIAGRNKVVSSALSPIENTVNAVLAGKLSPAEAEKLLAATTASMKAASDALAKANPNPFADSINSLVVPLALVAAIILLPKLMPQRREATA